MFAPEAFRLFTHWRGTSGYVTVYSYLSVVPHDGSTIPPGCMNGNGDRVVESVNHVIYTILAW
ncbi:hypothetical protein VFPPC_15719 [Pochonia chlamydosporia 170]|uniref:Uncharacterized protein n=1 Tax=Pochonia chlamydosporia 170 TaxID=1380566 RepID=A0A179FRE8_METCM|nr:hypothetical protein VFPPC_15719 [Pochonia chlamydosporia 170]OAQ67663.1 hypothetical protein VFPPC_15719 [Pochonia chlamydosporia 170]